MSDAVRRQLVLDASQHSADQPPRRSFWHFSLQAPASSLLQRQTSPLRGCRPNLQLPQASDLIFRCPPNTPTGIFQRSLPAPLHLVLPLRSGPPVSLRREAGVHPRPRPLTRPSPHTQSPPHLSPSGRPGPASPLPLLPTQSLHPPHGCLPPAPRLPPPSPSSLW